MADIPLILFVHLLGLFEAPRITNPIFDSATDIMTDLVNSEYVATDGITIFSLLGFPLVYDSQLFCE